MGTITLGQSQLGSNDDIELFHALRSIELELSIECISSVMLRIPLLGIFTPQQPIGM